MYEYDVLIIGSGPAGEKAAIQAAKLGKKAGLIEKNIRLGGVCIHTGTLPSKTLRETVLYISSIRDRGVYGVSCSVNKDITISELMYRKNIVIKKDEEVVSDNLYRNNIDVFQGIGSFEDEHTLNVKTQKGTNLQLTGEYIVVATGSKPDRPSHIPFEKENIYDSSTIINLDHIPKSMIILGGGVIGCEYACIFAHLGIRVTIIDPRAALLKFVGREFSDAIAYYMRKAGITLLLKQEAEKVEINDDGKIKVTSSGGKEINAETLLYTVKRIGDTDFLNLDKIKLSTDERGHIKVNENYQTGIPHIFAVGDVIGFPSLASTSMNQGRMAMAHAFSTERIKELNQILPFGIYTIPEISIVGETEKSLSEKGIPYEVGTAYYSEISRGLIIGDYKGILKIIFHPETLEILGTHIMGSSASDLIHVAQAAMSFKATLRYFIDTVFNVPTLTEAYKVAALNGYNKVLESQT